MFFNHPWKSSVLFIRLIIRGLVFPSWFLKWKSYPIVPRPDMGGLGGFCVGGLVLDSVPPLIDWLFPCCCGRKKKKTNDFYLTNKWLRALWVITTCVTKILIYRLPRWRLNSIDVYISAGDIWRGYVTQHVFNSGTGCLLLIAGLKSLCCFS